MDDDLIKEYLARHSKKRLQGASLESIRSGSTYFNLEMHLGSDGIPTYRLKWDKINGAGPGDLPVGHSHMAAALLGEIPFIPVILRRLKKNDLADRAESLHKFETKRIFLYDAVSSSNVRLVVQFDWSNPGIPNGFEFGVELMGEGSIVYEIHNDIVAESIKAKEPALNGVLRLCPEVVENLNSLESKLLSMLEYEQLCGLVPLPKSTRNSSRV